MDQRNYQFKVESFYRRFDLLLVDYFEEQGDLFSRSAIQQMIKNGKIKLNGKVVKASRTLNGGELVEIFLPEPQKIEIISQQIPLRIVYEDEFLIVVNKQAGMVVHPAPGNYEKTLLNALMFHCKGNLSTIGSPLRPGVVHRLDKLTSGLMVVAKNDAVHLDLAKQFATKTAKRIYIAVIGGELKNNEGVIDTFFGRHPHDRKKFTSKLISGKKAVTKYKLILQTLLDSKEKINVMRIVLETGRTHQIRVHLLEHLNPIIGDAVYTNKTCKNNDISRQALHAIALSFFHPKLKINMSFFSPLDEDIKCLLKKFHLI